MITLVKYSGNTKFRDAEAFASREYVHFKTKKVHFLIFRSGSHEILNNV